MPSMSLYSLTMFLTCVQQKKTRLNTQRFMGGDVMDFIKLTQAYITGDEGEPIYINVWRIEAIREGDGCSVVFVTGDNNAKYFVKESADAILDMINNIKRSEVLT